MKSKKRRMSLTTRSAWTGFLFATPFVLGFLFFFLEPLFQSVRFVFSNVDVSLAGYETTFVGKENLHYAFKVDSNFATTLRTTMVEMLWQVPIVVVFALLLAIVLNQKFRGRVFARAVFFFPVIIGTGIVLNIIRGDAAGAGVMAGDVVVAGTRTESDVLQEILINSGLSSKIISSIIIVSDSLLGMLWRVGVQMIIFLAGLQSISPALYEASAIEGATAWENFWKITLPMLLPILQLNVVYTVVDTVTNINNGIMQLVLANVQLSRYGWAAAMAWSYFLLIIVVLAVVFFIFARLQSDSEVRNRKKRRGW